MTNDTLPRIRIRYCPKCHWLPRSCWMAHELLYTFADELGGVTLVPERAVSGLFQIDLDENLLWCRKRDGGFPDVKALTQRVRDQIAPERDLGHVDG